MAKKTITLVEGKCVVDLVEDIERLFDGKPDARKKKEFADWKVQVNKLVMDVNSLLSFKMYNLQ